MLLLVISLLSFAILSIFQNRAKPDIFNRYNDIEVIKPKRPVLEERKGKGQENDGHLPNIKSDHQNGHASVTVNVTNTDAVDGGKTENNDAAKSDMGNGNISGEDEDMLEIPAFNLEDDSSDYGDFRQCQVSPVPTPVLQRPMTREQTRMSHEDKVSDILRGNVNRHCTAESKTIKIYISSGFTGKYNTL